MTLHFNKTPINLREKLSELERPIGIQGGRVMSAENLRDAYELTGSGRKNLIINGDMRIFQRGTTYSNTGLSSTLSGWFTADRWRSYVTMSGTGSIDLSYQQDATTHPKQTEAWEAVGDFYSSLKATVVSNSYVPSGTDSIALYNTRIESYDLNQLGYGSDHAKYATLSFWIRSNKTGTASLQIRITDSSSVSGSSDANFMTSYTIDRANTWEYKTIVIPPNTRDTWRRNISIVGFDIYWWFGSNQGNLGIQSCDRWRRANNFGQPHAHSTFNVFRDGGEFWLTGVQLEVGSQATPFEHRTLNEELTLCRRYYETSYNLNTAPGSITSDGEEVIDFNGASTLIVRKGVRYKVNKRSIPTVTFYNPSLSNTTGSARTNFGTTNTTLNGPYGNGNTGYFTDTTPSAGEFCRFHWTSESEI